MKKLIILCAVVLTTLLLTSSVAGCQQKSQPSSATGNIRMTATINGLEKGEEATLTISHEGSAASEELFFKRAIISDGKKAITVDIAANLEDGYYQLLLEAPDKYFREPKGYFFMVSQSQIVNPTGRKVIFNLLPQPEGLVAEAYISLSAPPKGPPPPSPLIISRAVPDEAYYLPGERVDVKVVFKNVSSENVKLEYLPEINVTKHENDEPVLYSWTGSKILTEIKPDDAVTVDFTWDQKDSAGNQVQPGWYDITWKDANNISEKDRRIGRGSTGMVLIRYPQGAMEKTIEVNQSQTAADITVTLERIELTSSGMMVYAFVTKPDYPPTVQSSPFWGSSTEYSVDGGETKLLSYSGIKRFETGARFIWGGTRPGMIDPIPSDAHELAFKIISMKVSASPDEPYKIVEGPWEFKIRLE